MAAARLTLIVLTRNEEANLPYCLRSVQGLASQICVVDSGSDDATQAIAESFGADFIPHGFTNQAEQFNWALTNLGISGDWVLRLDADEYLLPELAREMQETISSESSGASAFYIKRRMVFMGRWIRHGAYYPIWLLRLFRRGCVRSEQTEMDEHLVLTSGTAAHLNHDFVDENRKGLREWQQKHEAYAVRQARVLVSRSGAESDAGIRARLFGSQVERKRWLKHNVYGRCPLFVRPALYFLYRYFMRLGFLDGIEGLIFHYLHAGWYMFYVDATIWEMRRVNDASLPCLAHVHGLGAGSGSNGTVSTP